MASMYDLYVASNNVYKMLKNPDNPQVAAIPGFRETHYHHDKASDHSAVAYYNQATQEVIIAHRGSVTKKDWLVTDVQIALQTKITDAQIAAIRFTERVIMDLQRNHLGIRKILQSGHSKGGSESQMCVYENIAGIPSQSVTFNSPGINPPSLLPPENYQHINLRVYGAMVGDVVSLAGGRQLGGKTLVAKLDALTFYPMTHTMDSVKEVLMNNKIVAKLDLDQVFKLCDKKTQTLKEIGVKYDELERTKDIRYSPEFENSNR